MPGSPAGGPAPRELESEVGQGLERERRVRRDVSRLELDVHHAGRETDPHRCPRAARRAVRRFHPCRHADQAALPGFSGAAREPLEAGDDE